MIYVLAVLLVAGFAYFAVKLHRLETKLKQNADKTAAVEVGIGAVRTDMVTADQKIRSVAEKTDKVGRKVTEVDRRTTPGAMTQEQIDFKVDLEKRWKTAMEQARQDLAEQLVTDKDKLKEDVNKYKAGFEVALKKAYDEACAKIDFEKVEYKKTITKKRKEFSRKHKATTQQKQYRSIDDE